MRVKAVRIIFFLLIVFLAVPEFMLGVPSLVNGIRAHGDVWSVRHDYFTDAAVTLVPGLLAVLAAGYGAFFALRRHWVYAAISAFIVLYMAIAIPSFYAESKPGPAVVSKMHDLSHAVEEFADRNGKYPATASELESALKQSSF